MTPAMTWRQGTARLASMVRELNGWRQKIEHRGGVWGGEAVGGGMVAADRGIPTSGLSMERFQETGGVARVCQGIEGVLQRGECAEVVVQVDLEAADVDRLGAGPLTRDDEVDGLRHCLEEV
jgi:hypothetical protein